MEPSDFTKPDNIVNDYDNSSEISEERPSVSSSGEMTSKQIMRKMKSDKKLQYNRGEQITISSARFFSEKNIPLYLRSLDNDKIKSYCLSMNLGYSVASLSVIGDLNMGAIMRTAQLMGCDKYIVMGREQFSACLCRTNPKRYL
jgi:hypothetical protein